MTTTKSNGATILILHESIAQSWLRDASMFALAVSLIAPGWWLGSSAMQWAGLVVFFVAVLACVRPHRMTIAEARKKLDEIERGAP